MAGSRRNAVGVLFPRLEAAETRLVFYSHDWKPQKRGWWFFPYGWKPQGRGWWLGSMVVLGKAQGFSEPVTHIFFARKSVEFYERATCFGFHDFDCAASSPRRSFPLAVSTILIARGEFAATISAFGGFGLVFGCARLVSRDYSKET